MVKKPELIIKFESELDKNVLDWTDEDQVFIDSLNNNEEVKEFDFDSLCEFDV